LDLTLAIAPRLFCLFTLHWWEVEEGVFIWKRWWGKLVGCTRCALRYLSSFFPTYWPPTWITFLHPGVSLLCPEALCYSSTGVLGPICCAFKQPFKSLPPSPAPTSILPSLKRRQVHISILTCACFEERCGDLFHNTPKPIKKVVWDSNINKGNVCKSFLLVPPLVFPIRENLVWRLQSAFWAGFWCVHVVQMLTHSWNTSLLHGSRCASDKYTLLGSIRFTSDLSSCHSSYPPSAARACCSVSVIFLLLALLTCFNRIFATFPSSNLSRPFQRSVISSRIFRALTAVLIALINILFSWCLLLQLFFVPLLLRIYKLPGWKKVKKVKKVTKKLKNE
jgi:hypothetical protein